MPIYMDLHIGQGITSEDVAMAHQLDLKFQDDFKCRCITYWVDEKLGNAYCLIEAPSKESVIALHNHAHAQLPDEIIEVDKRVVKVFLGRLHDPIIADYFIDNKIKVFHDPAYRIILKMEIEDPVILRNTLRNEIAEILLADCRELFTDNVTSNGGCPADLEKWNFLASFLNAQDALQTSKTLIEKFEKYKKELNIKFIIHAGIPVDKHPKIFGKTLDALPLMSQIISGGQIIISNTANKGLRKELLNEDIITLNEDDENFLVNVSSILNKRANNFNIDIQTLTEISGMSQSSLYRKIVSIFKESPNKVLQDFKLNQTKKSLMNNEGSVAEVAFNNGFNSASYFSKCFTKKFGVKPSEYLS